jgi:preprotein translocase subunit SecE
MRFRLVSGMVKRHFQGATPGWGMRRDDCQNTIPSASSAAHRGLARACDTAPLEFPARPPYVAGIAQDMSPMMNPLQFLQQTRAEVAKVVWPTRREVLLTTLMVFLLSALAAAFFSLVDLAFRTGIQTIIGS